MKKIINLFLVILFVLNLTTVTFALAPPYVDTVEISGNETITMYVGDEITLEATATPGGVDFAYMLWTTDNDNIISLKGDDGTTKFEPPISTATIKATEVGTAVVTVYSDTFVEPYPDEYTANDSVAINVLPKESTPTINTEILNDIFIVTPTDVPLNSTVIFACYTDKSLVYVDTFDYQGNSDISFKSNKDYDHIKVMVFDKITNMIPLCEAEDVSLPENINLFMIN